MIFEWEKQNRTFHRVENRFSKWLSCYAIMHLWEVLTRLLKSLNLSGSLTSNMDKDCI